LAYRTQLDQMIQTVQQQDWPELEQQLTQTQQGRGQFKICQ
jgi:hypothetical protein